MENIYSLKVINKTQQHQNYRLELVDAEGFQLQGKTRISLAPGEIVDLQRCRQPFCRTTEPLIIP
ncbi:FixG Ig-like domain-containing protein [Pseudomonas sp. 31 R 17]|uniref:FixG Ig-like domain-containing protein n=1 Tax=Pseudomonas sp. 31 R 17 TaxID=1844101 RepID=UPI00351EB8CD